MGSSRFSFDLNDVGSIFKGAGIAAVGAAGAALLQYANTIGQSGPTAVIVGAVLSIAANAILKFVSDNTSKP